MATNVVCGHCGAHLDGPSSTCRNCGSAPYSGARALPRKSPLTAALLAAVIPGLGHVYLGDYKRGLAYFVGIGGLEFFGFDLDLTAIGAVVGIPLELGGVGLWLHGIWDAYNRAKRLP